MRASFRHSNQLLCGCIDPSGFEPSFLTVIEGTSGLVPETLFAMCALAVCRGQDVVVVDGGNRCNPSLVAVLYLSNLFSTQDGKKLFGSNLKNLKEITRSLNLVTVVTSFGGIWWGDRMVAGNADRVIRIDERKTIIKVHDGDNLFEYVPLPPGQTRFIDFLGGEINGQNCAKLQGAA